MTYTGKRRAFDSGGALKWSDVLPAYTGAVSTGNTGSLPICFMSPGESEYCLLPGLADVHVHLREPGFSYKETVKTGTLAAARGGFTAICSMPNLNPVPDSLENLMTQIHIIENDAVINVYPYGAITKGEKGERLSDLEALGPFVCAFSDDGSGVQSTGLMREAMLEAKRLGKIIAAHCEDNSLRGSGYVHSGAYAAAHGHRGIPSECEWRQLERDLELVAETGCAYHMCHASTKESVGLIRRAKAAGLDVTCETAPHYLLIDDRMMREDGRYKMNPPIRGSDDRKALIEGIQDGTIDIIATDHAPHARDEKDLGLSGSAFGVTGLECAFPVLFTHLVKTNICSLEKLIKLMAVAPRERFGLPLRENDFTVFNLSREHSVRPEEFLSSGKSTPFEGWPVYAGCVMTVCSGRAVWLDSSDELFKTQGGVCG